MSALQTLLARATKRPWPEGLVVNVVVDMALARLAVNRLQECVDVLAAVFTRLPEHDFGRESIRVLLEGIEADAAESRQ